MRPTYLYKVLSMDQWEKSQGNESLLLPEMDRAFIHLSQENQLERVLERRWRDVPRYVILTLETSKLPGELIYEANPGKSEKYYHLYNGSIPLKAVAKVKNVTQG